MSAKLVLRKPSIEVRFEAFFLAKMAGIAMPALQKGTNDA
jgi:hypothetical protein